jgi:predicted DNA-binding transcriptional regulator YafY
MGKNLVHPTNKASAILYIYDSLSAGILLTKEELLEKFNISSKTVGRYIKEVNMHLSEEHSGKEVIYDTVVGGYKLCQKSQQETVLQQKDILVLSKILLESRGLNYDETQILIEKLINHCNKKEQSFIKRMIGNEMENYIAPKHEKSLIEQIWQIHNAIKEQKKLKISYHRIGKDGLLEMTAKERIVFPQAVLFNEYYFYLCADIEGKEYDYPTIFRMDRIESYQLLEEHFRINYAQRFKEGEFRKITQFMYTGELQNITFKFYGRSLEAVLDRLPTAEVVKSLEDVFVIRARVFGQGIMMWLLSQGDNVEVIEPISMRNNMKEKLEGMLKRYSKE